MQVPQGKMTLWLEKWQGKLFKNILEEDDLNSECFAWIAAN